MNTLKKIAETSVHEVKWSTKRHLNNIKDRINAVGNKRRMVLRQHLNNLIASDYKVEEIRRELTYINRELNKKSA